MCVYLSVHICTMCEHELLNVRGGRALDSLELQAVVILSVSARNQTQGL